MANSGCNQFIKQQIEALELKSKQIQQTLAKQPHRKKKLKEFKDLINHQDSTIQALLRQINIIRTKVQQKQNKVQIQTNRKCEVLIQIQNIQIQLSNNANKIPNFFRFQPVQINYDKLWSCQNYEQFNEKKQSYTQIQDIKKYISSTYFQMIELEISSKSLKTIRNQYSISKFLCSFISNQLQYQAFCFSEQKKCEILSMKDVQNNQNQNKNQQKGNDYKIQKFFSNPFLEQNLLKVYSQNPLKFFIQNQKAYLKFKIKLKVFIQQKFNEEEAQLWKNYLKNLQIYIQLNRESKKIQTKKRFNKQKYEIQIETQQKQQKENQYRKSLSELVLNIKLMKSDLKILKSQYEACDNYIDQTKRQMNQLKQNLFQIEKKLDQNNSKKQKTIQKLEKLSKQYDYFESMRTKDLVQIQNAKKYLLQKLQKFQVQTKDKENQKMQAAKLKKVPIHSYKSSLNNNRVTIDTFDKDVEKYQNQECQQNILRPYLSKESFPICLGSGISSPNLFISPRNKTDFKSPNLPSTSYKSPQQFSSTQKMRNSRQFYNNSLSKYKNKKPQQTKSKYLSILMTKSPWK